MPEGKRPGIVCRFGRNDLAAGVARGMTISFSILGPLVGAAILWWVNDLGSKLDKIDARFSTLFQKLGTVEQFAAATGEGNKDRDAKVGDLVAVTKGHETRLTCLELTGHVCVR